MSLDPQFASTPRSAFVQVTTANSARDGSGTVATVFTASASGSLVDRIRINATGTTSTNAIRLFIHDGTNARLYEEIIVVPVTVGSTVSAWSNEIVFPMRRGLPLPSGYSLRASTNITETYNVFAFGGDL